MLIYIVIAFLAGSIAWYFYNENKKRRDFIIHKHLTKEYDTYLEIQASDKTLKKEEKPFSELPYEQKLSIAKMKGWEYVYHNGKKYKLK